jgi:hypothetical protein
MKSLHHINRYCRRIGPETAHVVLVTHDDLLPTTCKYVHLHHPDYPKYTIGDPSWSSLQDNAAVSTLGEKTFVTTEVGCEIQRRWHGHPSTSSDHSGGVPSSGSGISQSWFRASQLRRTEKHNKCIGIRLWSISETGYPLAGYLIYCLPNVRLLSCYHADYIRAYC